YLADKGIAAPNDVGDIPPPLLAIAQRFPQRGDMHTQGPFLDDDIGPQPSGEGLFGDHLTSLLDEREKQIPCSAAQPHWRLAFKQELPRWKQAKWTERELARKRRVARHLASFSCGTLHPCGTIDCTGFGHGRSRVRRQYPRDQRPQPFRAD